MNLLDILSQANGGQPLAALSSQFGLDARQTQAIVGQLLPALSQGLQRNAAQPGGLESLLGALSSGQHSRYLDDPSSLAQPEAVLDGNGILGHILGSKDTSRALASQVSGATGISDSVIKQMLPLVASLAMGALSRQKPSQPEGLLGLLDFNGDGSVIDDVGRLMGKFFNR